MLALSAIVAGLVVVPAVAPAAASTWPAAAGTTQRISVASGGTEGNNDSNMASPSNNGQIVAFSSLASNLVTGDTNAKTDVFVVDRATDVVTRVSVGSGSVQGNGDSDSASLSADGRYVAFTSSASNLVGALDTNGVSDVFVADRTTGAVVRVSVASGGTQGNNASDSPAISADGRYVSFTSTASNLVAGDTNAMADVFVADRTTGAVVSRVSVSTYGTQGNNLSTQSSISADGRYVVFESVASTLVPSDTNVASDIFLKDRTTAALTRVSVDDYGTQADDGSYYPTISANGLHIAFESDASNLVDERIDYSRHIYVANRATRVITEVDYNNEGLRPSGYMYGSSISADGRFVTFLSGSSAFAPEFPTGHHTYVVDRATLVVSKVSVSSDGTQGEYGGGGGWVSGDGTLVMFRSISGNLVPGATNHYEQLYARNLGTPAALPVPPGAPVDATADAGYRQAHVTWNPPASTGGSRISSYRVTASPGGAGCTSTWETHQGNQCDVYGLVNGTAYTFTVTATNIAGVGAASSATAPVVPRYVPDRPSSVTAVAGAESATVTWSAPASDGGAAITAYTVMASPGGSTCATTGSLSCTVPGLAAGTAYTFTVRATNVAGSSSPSVASAAVIPTPRVASPVTETAPVATTAPIVAPAIAPAPRVPGQPTRVVAMRGHLSAVVTWAAPAIGSPITSYRVVATPGGRSCVSATVPRCTVAGLANGKSYRFAVTASNGKGSGLPSVASLAAVPAAVPGVPSRVVAVRGNARATVAWSLPAANGTAAVTGYRVVATPGGASCTTTGLARCVVVGLVNGRSYSFAVVAINKVGSSPQSIAAVAVPATVPGAVRLLAATFPAALRTVATWTAPASTGGVPLLRYEFRTSADAGRTWTRWTSAALARSATVPGLVKDRSYLLEVRAVTAAGAGAGMKLAVRPTR